MLFISSLLLCVSLFSLLESFCWIFEVLANFREHIFLFTCFHLFVVAFLKIKKSKILLSLFFILILNGFFVSPFLIRGLQTVSKIEAKRSKSFKLISVNINSRNSEKIKLINYIKKQDPDVLVLIETSHAWKGSLEQLKSLLPYEQSIFLNSNFGMAIFSRFPILDRGVYGDRGNLIPALSVNLNTDEGSLAVFALHPFPPIGHWGVLVKNQYLRTLSSELRKSEGSLLACGDFNTSPWTQVMKNFVENAKLSYPDGFSPLRTWPALAMVPKLSLDHCLVRGIVVEDYQRGPDVGSDHYPVEITFQLDSFLN